MSGIHYFGHIDRLLYEYYTAELAIPSSEREKPGYRNPQMAELADTVVRLLEQEADHYRHYAARWRGEH
ncbi:hypothetical protein ABZ342_32595 [Amycolatopsis sp. NPDC005961]|uniref:hypothetical protein n=1 Tax=Amycolatopsis sp. NPDC005961 TaxID=3156720 RepID=UPI00340E8F15